MANPGFITVASTTFRELIKTGDVIEIEHEGKVVRAIVTDLNCYPCDYSIRLLEISKIPNVNPELLKLSRCRLENECLGDIIIIGIIDGLWKSINKCLIDRFTNTVTFRPIDCTHQKQFEDFL